MNPMDQVQGIVNETVKTMMGQMNQFNNLPFKKTGKPTRAAMFDSLKNAVEYVNTNNFTSVNIKNIDNQYIVLSNE